MAERMLVAMERLSERLQDVNSRSITYARGAYSVTLDATVGRTSYQADDVNRLRVFHGDRDYIFPAELLILNGSQATPTDGDKITDSVDGKVFLVRDRDGEPCFRPCDGYGVDIRVHCFEKS